MFTKLNKNLILGGSIFTWSSLGAYRGRNEYKFNLNNKNKSIELINLIRKQLKNDTIQSLEDLKKIF